MARRPHSSSSPDSKSDRDAATYESRVFVNCPFDPAYRTMFEAIVFAVNDAGFQAHCALEIDDGTGVRIEKIFRPIEACRYGIHDLSRTEQDPSGLPRFNMPLELGIFLGCKRFGGAQQRRKSGLILDREPYRYQQFLSDIAGQDVRSHDGDCNVAIRRVRDFLRTETMRTSIPGETAIQRRFAEFVSDLPELCQKAEIGRDELTFADYSNLVTEWLQQNYPLSKGAP